MQGVFYFYSCCRKNFGIVSNLDVARNQTYSLCMPIILFASSYVKDIR